MKCVKPSCLCFQEKFSNFYKLDNGIWKKATVMRPLFFQIFTAFQQLNKNGTAVNYETVITVLSSISGMTEKSFASKIFHTLIPDEPILDKNVIIKLNDESNSWFRATTKYKGKLNPNFAYSVNEAIDLYKCLENYYGLLKNDVATQSYINDFDAWANKNGVNLNLISDTQKIDFWMWIV